MRKLMLLSAFTICAASALAQHGPHGGSVSGGHLSAPVGRIGGGFSAPRPQAPTRMIGGYPVPRQQTPMRRGNWTSSSYGHGGWNKQPTYYHYHHVGYGYGVVGYPVFGYPTGYLNLNGDLNLDDNDPNDPSLQANSNYSENNAGQVPYVDSGYPDVAQNYGPQDRSRPPYNPGGFANSSSIESDGMSHPEVTLIFKDGRPPLQIQNYVMTQMRVFVRDRGMDRDFPVSDLDVPATLAANSEAGVDFSLPVGR
jgi:hypothetical protein